MKAKYPSIFGVLAILMLLVTMLPMATAEAGTLKWTTLDTPMGYRSTAQIVSPSEVNRIAIGSDGKTFYAVDIPNYFALSTMEGWVLPIMDPTHTRAIWRTTNASLSWSDKIGNYLWQSMCDEYGWDLNTDMDRFYVWDVAIAPDDPNFVAVVTSGDANGNLAWDMEDVGPVNVWLSTNGGTQWMNARAEQAIDANGGAPLIGAIDISPSYASHDVAIGTRAAHGGPADGEVFILQYPGIGGFTAQGFDMDYFTPLVQQGNVTSLKFSPSYAGDSCIVVIASGDSGLTNATWINGGIRDIAVNTTLWNAATPLFTNYPVELADLAQAVPGDSPDDTQIITTDLELPSDYSGQTSHLRRYYVAVDAAFVNSPNNSHEGVFRADDTVVYRLMPATPTKRISSIAYYGTYASGKLMAGEVLGDCNTATVMTWFTPDPTVCPGVCWFPALKPTTGAACNCYGNAQVAWNPDGSRAYVGTSGTDDVVVADWPRFYRFGAMHDESAFSITRNDNETWNQLSLIDTQIDFLSDVTPAPDCSIVYLSSINADDSLCEDLDFGEVQDNCLCECQGFDSVWRSPNPDFAAYGVGTTWERVLCTSTGTDPGQELGPLCNQVDYAILRLAQDKTDGEVVFWGAGGAFPFGSNTNKVLWSPDYGDIWYLINPRIDVQDMAAPDSSTLHLVDGAGMVQTIKQTGMAWSTMADTVDCCIASGKEIRAVGDHVLIGGVGAVAYSADGAQTFSIPQGTKMVPKMGANHVAFSHNFLDSKIFYVGVEDIGMDDGGSVYRWQIGVSRSWTDLEPIDGDNVGYNGLAVATEGTLYTANSISFAERTLDPQAGVPKPGIEWDWLWTGIEPWNPPGDGVSFTLEPNSLKICGCLTPDTNSTLWAIDNDDYLINHWPADDTPLSIPGPSSGSGIPSDGLVWMYEDCLAKAGPVASSPDLIGCDPVSGRNQEINLTWEQLCLSEYYQVQIAKDANFTLSVWDYRWYRPIDVTVPTFIVPPGGIPAGVSINMPYWVEELIGLGADFVLDMNLNVKGYTPTLAIQPIIFECGHDYYWRVRTVGSAYGEPIRSPWSDAQKFSIKAGLPVSTPYLGIQLLSPNNGVRDWPVKPVSFSWSPFMDTSKYKFVLAKDAACTTDIIAKAEVTATAYEYDGTLDYNTNYFWKVQGLSPVSDWGATFSFMTEGAPPTPDAPAPPPATPMWVWVVIALGAILVIVTIILIFKTRRA